jgi:hypothetical protein
MDWMRAEQSGEIIKLTERVNLATYNLQIFTPPVRTLGEAEVYLLDATDRRVLADLPAMLESVEERLVKLLPEGYEARITEWNR